MDPPDDLYALYAEFGIAAEKAQVLEVEAGNLVLCFVTFFLKPADLTAEQREFFRNLVDDVNRQTFGTLLKTVKSIATLDRAMLEAIETALERRNYLMHHFFRSHNFAILQPAGRQAMLDELRQIQHQLDLGQAMLHGMTATLQLHSGHEGLSEEITRQLMEEGKRVDL